LKDPGEINRSFYDALWREARIQRPEKFNTWPLVEALAPSGGRRLEIGPGLRPRLPIAGTIFADASRPAVDRLGRAGGEALVSDAASLPFGAARFDLVATFDLVEHHPDDGAVVAEIARVLSPGGCWLVAVPLHARAWSEFDEFVGHYRRYDPPVLRRLVAAHGFHVERSAVFGMQPKNRLLLRIGMWMMTHSRARAMRWYNHVLVPLALRFQRPLEFQTGLLAAEGVDEVVLLCRRQESTEGHGAHDASG
jgi:SAM-dependent methyltransferase